MKVPKGNFRYELKNTGSNFLETQKPHKNKKDLKEDQIEFEDDQITRKFHLSLNESQEKEDFKENVRTRQGVSNIQEIDEKEISGYSKYNQKLGSIYKENKEIMNSLLQNKNSNYYFTINEKIIFKIIQKEQKFAPEC